MAVNLSPVGGVAAQFFNNDGVPLAGGLIYTYTAGTSTPQATYTTSTGAIEHTNPIVLDSAGRVPGGEIWLTDGATYKFVIKDANLTLIGTYDNLVGINSNFINYTSSQEIQTATAGQTVFTLTTMAYQPGTHSLSVFVDGVNQYGPGAQYAFTETSSTSVTFVNGLHVGASVKFTTSAVNSSSYGNAFQISYTPPFANSVATNVGAKLSETVSVKDFGAIGDGNVDDTDAIQNAVNSGAKKILGVASDIYLISSISIPSDTELDFQGASVVANTESVNLFENLGYSGAGNSNIAIKNVNIDGAKGTKNSVIGMAFQYITNLTIENANITDCGGNGIFVGTNSANIMIQNCNVRSCGDDGTNSFNSANINILGGTADFPNAIRVKGISVVNCNSYSAWGIGLIFQFSDVVNVTGGEYSYNGRGLNLPSLNGNGIGGGQLWSATFSGISSNNNAESGFDIASKSRLIHIVGNSSYDNGYEGIFCGHSNGGGYSIVANSVTTNGRNGIWVSDTLQSVMIADNYVSANTDYGIYADSLQYVVVSNNVVKDHLSGIGYGIVMSDTSGSIDGGCITGNLAINNVLDYYNPYKSVVEQGNYGTQDRVITNYTSAATYNVTQKDNTIACNLAAAIETLPNPGKLYQGASYKFINNSSGSVTISTATNGLWIAGTLATTNSLAAGAVASYLCIEISVGTYVWVRN